MKTHLRTRVDVVEEASKYGTVLVLASYETAYCAGQRIVSWPMAGPDGGVTCGSCLAALRRIRREERKEKGS